VSLNAYSSLFLPAPTSLVQAGALQAASSALFLEPSSSSPSPSPPLLAAPGGKSAGTGNDDSTNPATFPAFAFRTPSPAPTPPPDATPDNYPALTSSTPSLPDVFSPLTTAPPTLMPSPSGGDGGTSEIATVPEPAQGHGETGGTLQGSPGKNAAAWRSVKEGRGQTGRRKAESGSGAMCCSTTTRHYVLGIRVPCLGL